MQRGLQLSRNRPRLHSYNASQAAAMKRLQLNQIGENTYYVNPVQLDVLNRSCLPLCGLPAKGSKLQSLFSLIYEVFTA